MPEARVFAGAGASGRLARDHRRRAVELEDKLTTSLRRGLQRRLPGLYDQARRSAEASLRVHGEDAAAGALPAKCPYRLADLLRHDWHPASRHGLAL